MILLRKPVEHCVRLQIAIQMSRMTALSDKFASKIDKNGPVNREDLGACWIWKGYRYRDGYGDFVVRIRGRYRHFMAHRAAWMLATGKRIPEGFEVCHKCDCRACVNPDHLFVGTHSDNERDKVAKGRNVTPFGRVGERSLRAKMTDAQVVELRFRALDPGVPLADLARRFGVSESTINDALRGVTYPHLPVLEVPRRRNKNSPRTETGIICSRCNADKPLSEYRPSLAARGSGVCRACCREVYATSVARQSIT